MCIFQWKVFKNCNCFPSSIINLISCSFWDNFLVYLSIKFGKRINFIFFSRSHTIVNTKVNFSDSSQFQNCHEGSLLRHFIRLPLTCNVTHRIYIRKLRHLLWHSIRCSISALVSDWKVWLQKNIFTSKLYVSRWWWWWWNWWC